MLTTLAGKVWGVTEPLADALQAAVQSRGIEAALDAVAARLEPARLEARRGGVVAVVPVLGMLSQRPSFWGTSTAWLADVVTGLVADNGVHAVVLEVDSPGGEVYGVTEAAAAIRAAAAVKPIVASANPFIGSAAYNLASQASEIWVTPSGEVGSIGCFGMHVDMSGALEKMGLKVTVVKAGKFKAEGHPAAPLSEDAVGHMQEQCDRYYGMFVADVAKGRSAATKRTVSVETVRGPAFGEGRMVGAKRAVEQGMADGIGTLAEAVKRAAQLGAERRRGLAAIADAQAFRSRL
jgi:signal peptide peptidase SppA